MKQLEGMKYFFAIVALAIIGHFGLPVLDRYYPEWFEGDAEYVQSYEVLPGGKIAPLTVLSEEDLAIQEEGCVISECHPKR